MCKTLLSAIIEPDRRGDSMSRLWVSMSVWVVALVAVALMIPLISEQGTAENASLIAGSLVVLQFSGLGLTIYAAMAAWKVRKTPRLMARYAAIPLVLMIGVVCLGPLVALSQAIVG